MFFFFSLSDLTEGGGFQGDKSPYGSTSLIVIQIFRSEIFPLDPMTGVSDVTGALMVPVTTPQAQGDTEFAVPHT